MAEGRCYGGGRLDVVRSTVFGERLLSPRMSRAQYEALTEGLRPGSVADGSDADVGLLTIGDGLICRDTATARPGRCSGGAVDARGLAAR